MAIESEIYKYLTENLDEDYKIYWGKVDRDEANPRDDVVISFFKTPSQSSQITPSYLDIFQISVFAPYIDTATSVANDIIELFQLHILELGNYRVWVNNIINQGSIYDDEDVVQVVLNLGLKYSGI